MAKSRSRGKSYKTITIEGPVRAVASAVNAAVAAEMIEADDVDIRNHAPYVDVEVNATDRDYLKLVFFMYGHGRGDLKLADY
jgi:stage V sporulation protein SpoVS